MFWFNRCEAKMPAAKPITVKTAVLKKPVAVVESKSTPTYMPIIKEKVSLKNIAPAISAGIKRIGVMPNRVRESPGILEKIKIKKYKTAIPK